jgi:hypothetical protein
MILKKIAASVFDSWECEKIGDTDNYLIITDTILPNNDCIEIVAEPAGNDKYIIHDAGTLFNYLFLYGINLSEDRYKLKKLNRILENYRADFINNRIEKKTDSDNFPRDISLLIQAIRESAIFHYMMKPVGKANFKEEVYKFFVSREADVNMDYAVSGKIKPNHKIDIRLNGNSELLSKIISAKTPSMVQDQLESAWFIFGDIKDAGRNFMPVIFYDDTDREKKDALKKIHIEQIKRSPVKFYRFKHNSVQLEEIAKGYRKLQIPLNTRRRKLE